MNIALTGSSGLIGSNFAEDLKKAGHAILRISSSNTDHKEHIYSYNEIKSLKLSINVDCIIHLASINSNLTQEEITLEVALAKTVIDLMEILDCKRIIFFSTIKVYGDNSFERNIFTEDSNLDPICDYGKAKLECESVITQYSEKKHINYTILRMPPLMINNPKSNLGILFKLVQKSIPIPTFKIGNNNQRSFLSYNFLFSVVQAMLLDDQGKSTNEIFNVSDSEPISTNDLFRRIGINLNKKVWLIYLPNFIFKFMMSINRLQLILIRLYGNFYISNAKLKEAFSIQDSI